MISQDFIEFLEKIIFPFFALKILRDNDESKHKIYF